MKSMRFTARSEDPIRRIFCPGWRMSGVIYSVEYIGSRADCLCAAAFAMSAESGLVVSMLVNPTTKKAPRTGKRTADLMGSR